MIQIPDIFLTRLIGTIYWLEGLNKRQNRPFARWRHFTTTTRIVFVFPFMFKLLTNLMYKCINNLTPAYLCDLFAPRKPIELLFSQRKGKINPGVVNR